MDPDITVIGGGIIGLATARSLLQKYPNLKLVVAEKEDSIARHQSGHNSGVIHTGIYYTPGSLKAKLCVKGADMMYQYAKAKDIPHNRIGKVIVAKEEGEHGRLEKIFSNGQANGVKELELIDSNTLRKIEPHCQGTAAIHVPGAGIINFASVAQALLEEIQDLGGQLVTNFEVRRIDHGSKRVRLTCQNGTTIRSHYVIACGGLHSDQLCKQSNAKADMQIIPFRGDYLQLKEHAKPLVRGLIYPVPDPRFPFLGVHFTPRINGGIWLGPNAVLAFAREGYKFTTIDWSELFETLAYPGFRKLARAHWKIGAAEMYRDLFRRAYVKALQAYIPELKVSDCIAGPSGVRAQAVYPDGTLVDDFVFNEDHHRILHVCNAPSPGATSSLAIAEYIRDYAAERFSL